MIPSVTTSRQITLPQNPNIAEKDSIIFCRLVSFKLNSCTLVCTRPSMLPRCAPGSHRNKGTQLSCTLSGSLRSLQDTAPPQLAFSKCSLESQPPTRCSFSQMKFGFLRHMSMLGSWHPFSFFGTGIWFCLSSRAHRQFTCVNIINEVFLWARVHKLVQLRKKTTTCRHNERQLPATLEWSVPI